jgi:hypothetical protein
MAIIDFLVIFLIIVFIINILCKRRNKKEYLEQKLFFSRGSANIPAPRDQFQSLGQIKTQENQVQALGEIKEDEVVYLTDDSFNNNVGRIIKKKRKIG